MITNKDKILTGIALAVGASITVCYDILQDIIKSVAPRGDIIIKLEAGGIAIGFGVFTVVVLLNYANKHWK